MNNSAVHHGHVECDSAAAAPAAERRPALGVSRFSAIEFLVVLLLLFIASPFIEDLEDGDLIEAVLLTLVLVSAVIAVGGSARTVVVAAVLMLLATAGKWLNHFRPDLVPAALFQTAALLFATFVVVHHLGFILRAPAVNSQVLCAGISTFLMVGLLFAFGYLLLDSVAPGSFVIRMGRGPTTELSGFNAFYFSFGMLGGATFGEVTPVSNAARMLAVIESLTGMFYMAVLIARLVALHTSGAAGR